MITRRVVGRSILILGHVLAIALAVLVPIVIVAFNGSILRTTAISAVLMAMTLVMIIGGDRIIGYRSNRRARAVQAVPVATNDDRPFMLADRGKPVSRRQTDPVSLIAH